MGYFWPDNHCLKNNKFFRDKYNLICQMPTVDCSHTDLLDTITGNQTFIFSSSSRSAWLMKRACCLYARIDKIPFCVSVKLENTGDRFVDSILLSWRADATYTRYTAKCKCMWVTQKYFLYHISIAARNAVQIFIHADSNRTMHTKYIMIYTNVCAFFCCSHIIIITLI